MNPFELNALLASPTLGPEALLVLVAKHQQVLNGVNCATAIHRLARATPANLHERAEYSVLLTRMAALLVAPNRLQSFNARTLTNALWGLAKLGTLTPT